MDEWLRRDLREAYGLRCGDAVPVEGGWLNRKWRIRFDGGEALVKEFSPARYGPEKMARLESALRRQIFVREKGVPCPAVRLCGGRAVRFAPEGAYAVMEFCPGRTEGPDTVSLPQLKSLGDVCGRMRRAFSALPSEAEEDFCGGIFRALRLHYERALADCPPDAPAGYREAVLAMGPAMERISPAFLARQPRGTGHEDFAADNILFGPDGVSAVVDFDRSQHGFCLHDAGRAVLSFCLRDGRLLPERIEAFAAGYARWYPFGRRELADALKIAWCVEAPWWIRPEFFGECSPKTARFREELVRLTEMLAEGKEVFGR